MKDNTSGISITSGFPSSKQGTLASDGVAQQLITAQLNNENGCVAGSVLEITAPPTADNSNPAPNSKIFATEKVVGDGKGIFGVALATLQSRTFADGDYVTTAPYNSGAIVNLFTIQGVAAGQQVTISSTNTVVGPVTTATQTADILGVAVKTAPANSVAQIKLTVTL